MGKPHHQFSVSTNVFHTTHPIYVFIFLLEYSRVTEFLTLCHCVHSISVLIFW